MNEYSTTVMAGSFLIPDVKSYTKSAIFCLGKTDATTGYWSHGIQVRNIEINLYSKTYFIYYGI